MSKLACLAVLATLLLVACDRTFELEAAPQDSQGEPHSSSEAPAPSADAELFPLACGCALDDVGVCGEYIEVGGAYLELVPPLDLGSMPFCHEEGLQARADGAVQDGKFVASTFAYED